GELPHWPAPPAEAGGARGALLPEAAALDRLRRSMSQAGIHARPEGHWMAAEHTFSHIVWTLQVYRCREEAALPLAAEGRAMYGAAPAERGDSPLDADAEAAHAERVAAALGIQPAEDAPLALFDSGDAAADAADSGAQRWISREDMKNYAFPNVFLKLLNSYFDEQET
ncbi:A/G-specific adenine glycosylase, partial [Paenibacillus sp. FSL R7-269]